MIKILFVCLGNICRSPLAEGVFAHYIDQKGHRDIIVCDSAGTAGYHIGDCPDSRSVKTAQSYGIELKHLGRKLAVRDFDDFDYIMAMDHNNYQDIMALKNRNNPDGKAKVFMFRDFDPAGKGNVPDPYYGSMKDFEEVYEMCHRTSENLLEFILKNEKLDDRP